MGSTGPTVRSGRSATPDGSSPGKTSAARSRSCPPSGFLLLFPSLSTVFVRVSNQRPCFSAFSVGRALELRICIRPFCYASGLTVASCRPVPSLVASLVLLSRAIFVCRSLPKHDGLSLTAPCFQDVQSWLVRRSVFLLACVRWLLVKDASFDYGIGCSGGGSDVFVFPLCICCGPIRGISCHPGHRVQTATCSHNCPQQLSPLPVARLMAPSCF